MKTPAWNPDYHEGYEDLVTLRRQVDELKSQRGILIMVMREIVKNPEHAKDVARATIHAMTRGYNG